MQVDRKKLVRWLLSNGFVETNGASGHLHYTHPTTSIKITVPGHGPVDMNRKHSAMIMKQLVSCGLDRDWLREEMAAL